MASFNKVLLMGNLTRDPELTFTPTQVAICKFGLAVNRRFRTKTGEEREEVLFVDCTSFDKKAEVIHQYCTKGKPIFIEGQLKMDNWEDKQTGQKRSKLYVIVDNFQFMGGRDDGEGGGGGGGGGRSDRPAQRQAPRPPARPQQQAPAEEPFADDNTFKEDDIPF